MDLVKRNSLGRHQQPPTAADFPPLKTAGKKQTKSGPISAPKIAQARSIDPHAAASAAASKIAQLAMNISQAAIAKHPPTALEKLKHGGKFYTMTDAYGNKVPVVYVANLPQPLTEKTILESREEAESSNFAIIPSVVEDAKQEQTTTDASASPVTVDNVQASADTPLMKNTKGTPPKIFHRYLGNIPGATSKDIDRQFWKRA